MGRQLVGLEIIAIIHHSTIFGTDVYTSYSPQSLYIATHLHTVYLDCLQVVRESNLRCA
jgi:hypothetical protein